MPSSASLTAIEARYNVPSSMSRRGKGQTCVIALLETLTPDTWTTKPSTHLQDSRVVGRGPRDPTLALRWRTNLHQPPPRLRWNRGASEKSLRALKQPLSAMDGFVLGKRRLHGTDHPDPCSSCILAPTLSHYDSASRSPIMGPSHQQSSCATTPSSRWALASYDTPRIVPYEVGPPAARSSPASAVLERGCFLPFFPPFANHVPRGQGSPPGFPIPSKDLPRLTGPLTGEVN
eukprot:scaffold320_cov335-Pavlova_lutheri.AAC.25